MQNRLVQWSITSFSITVVRRCLCSSMTFVIPRMVRILSRSGFTCTLIPLVNSAGKDVTPSNVSNTLTFSLVPIRLTFNSLVVPDNRRRPPTIPPTIFISELAGLSPKTVLAGSIKFSTEWLFSLGLVPVLAYKYKQKLFFGLFENNSIELLGI